MSTFQKDLFRDRLRALRKQRKLTQADAAELFKVSRTCYSSWELGQSSPPMDDLYKLCFTFHVSADYLLGLTDSVNGTQSIPVSIPTSTVQRDPFFGLLPDQRELIENNIALMRKQNEKALATSTQEA